MLVIDNLTVEQVLTVPEVVDALEHAHKALSTGDAINAPNYRVFTPRDGKDYGPKFPEGGNPTHHAFTSLTGAIGSLDVTSDRVDSTSSPTSNAAKKCAKSVYLARTIANSAE